MPNNAREWWMMTIDRGWSWWMKVFWHEIRVSSALWWVLLWYHPRHPIFTCLFGGAWPKPSLVIIFGASGQNTRGLCKKTLFRRPGVIATERAVQDFWGSKDGICFEIVWDDSCQSRGLEAVGCVWQIQCTHSLWGLPVGHQHPKAAGASSQRPRCGNDSGHSRGNWSIFRAGSPPFHWSVQGWNIKGLIITNVG